MTFLGTLLLFLFGAAVGSFLAAALYRIPSRQSLSGRSHCPRCEEQIRSRDNIPVLGWLLLRGRSSCCREPISPRYLLVEGAAGLLGVLAALLGLAIPFVIGSCLLCLGAALLAEIRSR